jgi:DNA-binding NarL/FixJ family response regulator
MSIRVAVVDPLPMFSRGIVATLGDAGVEADTPEDLLTWVRDADRPIVLLTLVSQNDWALLDSLRRTRPDIVVIAVVDRTRRADPVRALVAGAVGIVPRDAPPMLVRRAFEAAAGGESLLPIDVVRTLASSPGAGDDRPGVVSSQEIDWLRRLAQGSTIAQLAVHSGYSERMMFRLLRDLYGKLRVAGRTEAIIHAHEQGWI